MRAGSVFRRCSACGARVDDRRCPRCGGGVFGWSFIVDVAPIGESRQQGRGGGFKTKAAALQAMSTLQSETAAGTHVEPSNLTVRAYLDGWVGGGCGGHIRPSTLASYGGIVRTHITPRIGDVSLQRLDRARVKALYQQLRSSGYAKGKVSAAKGLSDKSIHNVHLALRKALADAVSDGLLKRNPADAGHRLPTDRPEMLTWTAEELRAFLDSVAREPLSALWRLAAQTGLRRGEVLALRWGT